MKSKDNTKINICLFDHHDYIIPTDGIGGVIGTFQTLYEELTKFDLRLTLIINEKTKLKSRDNFKIISLPFNEIEKIRYGIVPIVNYFNGDIFYSNSSGRHVNFDFSGFNGKWVSTCHGCQEWAGGSDVQVFVSNNQLLQHLRDGYFDEYSNNYRVIHNSINTKNLYHIEGKHNRLVWMGRIDGAKAERLYDIAINSKEKILMAGWYSNEWEWLFNKIMQTNNVEWLGKIEGDENKVKFYSNAKVSIHCSTFEDPCPLTVLEAQACGVPVISYANGSMNEICYYKDLIFSEKNKFIEKLNSFNTEEYVKEDIINFIKFNFNTKNYAKKYYNIFNELTKCNFT